MPHATPLRAPCRAPHTPRPRLCCCACTGSSVGAARAAWLRARVWLGAWLYAPCPRPFHARTHTLTTRTHAHFTHTRAHVAGRTIKVDKDGVSTKDKQSANSARARASLVKAIEDTVTGTGAAYYKALLLSQTAQHLVDEQDFYRSLKKRAPRDFIITAITALQVKLRSSSSSGGSSGGGGSGFGDSGSSGGK